MLTHGGAYCKMNTVTLDLGNVRGDDWAWWKHDCWSLVTSVVWCIRLNPSNLLKLMSRRRVLHNKRSQQLYSKKTETTHIVTQTNVSATHWDRKPFQHKLGFIHVSNKSVRTKRPRDPESCEGTLPIKTLIICQVTSLTTNTLTIIGETHHPSTRPKTLNVTRNNSKEHSKTTSSKFRKQWKPSESCARTWTGRHPWNAYILTDIHSSQSTEPTVETHCAQYTHLWNLKNIDVSMSAKTKTIKHR